MDGSDAALRNLVAALLGEWRDFSKFSFAWRLFRYERKGDDSLKMDLLFIPIRRKGE